MSNDGGWVKNAETKLEFVQNPHRAGTTKHAEYETAKVAMTIEQAKGLKGYDFNLMG